MSEQRSGRNKRRRRSGGGGGGEGGGGGQRGRGDSRPNRRGGRSRGRGNRPVGLESPPEGEPTVDVRGIAQVDAQGYGFLRDARVNYGAEPTDPVLPRSVVREFGIMTGVEVVGRAIERDGRAPAVAAVTEMNGVAPDGWINRATFKDLVAESPSERIRLETDTTGVSTRIIDLIAPIGKGQRCLIVAPPKAGKTVLLQQIATSITTNHPEIQLIVLLVDERPEEVTDMRRTIQGEVIASSSDETPAHHIKVAEMVIERAKGLVECGRDVVVLLDSITRLARAYNAEQRGSGRVLSGGMDSRTMEKPRRFFGAARKAEDGGSLTVIATALVDTGSRMDEVIFQEFKGTGNTEIVMDRKLFEMRIFPAIDIAQSGTRKEEMLLTPDEYEKVTLLRRALASLRAAEAMRLLTERIASQPDNAAFLETMAQ